MFGVRKLIKNFFWVIPIFMFLYFVFLSGGSNQYVVAYGLPVLGLSTLLFLFIKYRFEIMAFGTVDAWNFLKKYGKPSKRGLLFIVLFGWIPHMFWIWAAWDTFRGLWDSSERYREDHNPHLKKLRSSEEKTG